MSRQVRLGFTRDFLDKEGNFVLPGPALKLLEEMPGVERTVFPEFVPEATPQMI